MRDDILIACTALLLALGFAKKSKLVVWTGNIVCFLIIAQLIMLPFHIR